MRELLKMLGYAVLAAAQEIASKPILDIGYRSVAYQTELITEASVQEMAADPSLTESQVEKRFKPIHKSPGASEHLQVDRSCD